MKIFVTYLLPRVSAPSLGELWYLAGENRERYTQLLRRYGYIVPGPRQPLPCGWDPGRRIPLDGRNDLVYPVRSFSGNGVYPVRHLPDGRWFCPCKDFEFHGHERPCKHVPVAMRREAALLSAQGAGVS